MMYQPFLNPMNSKRILIALILFACIAPCARAQVPADSYTVETVTMPEGIAPEASGIAFAANGDLAACFRRGHIYIRDAETLEWKKFASGLHTPLGMLAGEPGEFFVVQQPELTRVADTDGDGVADVYETISDGWGLSGNYHEMIAGPARDRDGNFYVALGSASFANGELPQEPVRGELTRAGHRAENPAPGLANRSEHYSPVPYRGWVVKVSPDGELTPVSKGLRQPNGIGVNPDGEVFVVDNQGDWVNTSPLHHVTPGAFHGHPSSLNWDPEFAGDPMEASMDMLRALRKLPAIQFPQNDMAGSIAQPLADTTGGKFGPFTGQLIVAEWTYARIFRVSLEKVNGVYQGACFPFIEGLGLRSGNNRLAFAPDGSLYVAQTSRGWGATEGIQRIAWTGKTPFDILDMKLTRRGFAVTFTSPVSRETAKNPAAWPFIQYYYEYSGEYGGSKQEVKPVKVTGVEVSKDARTVLLTLEHLTPGRILELHPRGVTSADGEALAAKLAAYTLNEVYE